MLGFHGKYSKRVNAGVPGMDWKVNVYLVPPVGLAGAVVNADLAQIRVGFVQVVSSPFLRVRFPGKVLIAKDEGLVLLDAGPLGVPWYLGYNKDGRQIEQINNQNANLVNANPYTLRQIDSPGFDYPIGLNDATEATANLLLALTKFTTDVAVNVLGDPADSYWPQARFRWLFDGSGFLVRDPANVTNVNWVPLSVPVSLNPLTFKRITGVVQLLNNRWILNNGSNMPGPEPVDLPLSSSHKQIPWTSRPG